MVTMSTVWDRSAEFIGDHLAAVAAIAGAAIFVPIVLWQLLLPAYPGTAGGGRLALSLLWLALALVSFGGRLALIALVLEPAAGPRSAARTAAARFAPAVGVSVALLLALTVATLPLSFLTGGDLSAVESGAMPAIDGRTAAAVTGYGLIALVVMLWASARLAVTWPVVVAERRGLGALPRAFRLTRGLAGRILGVLILFGVVTAVATLAAKTVVGSLTRIAFGTHGGWDAATIVTAMAVALVSTLAWTIVATFLAMLYQAVRDRAAGAP